MRRPYRKKPKVPTTKRLTRDLEEAGAPPDMIQRATDGYYDDFKSPLPMPIYQLVQDAQAAGLPAIARNARLGKYDAPKWEADAWAKSAEGQRTVREFFGKGE